MSKKNIQSQNMIWMYLSIVLCIPLLLLGVYGFFQYHYSSSISYVAIKKHVPYIRPLDSNERYKWTSSSKYTLVIYYSLDCKYCRKLNNEIEKNRSQYEGKFNLAFRNAPLIDLEPLSKEKALITECVYKQSGTEGMYSLINAIYSNYREFQRNNDWVIEQAKKYITQKDAFSVCLKDTAVIQKIENDVALLGIDGIHSTPSIGIFFNGELVGKYSAGFNGTMAFIKYLATFDNNADQFWSEDLFNQIYSSKN